MSRLTIEELKRVQKHSGQMDVHFVSMDEDGFTIAHTDDERARKEVDPLEECALHTWLLDYGPPEIEDDDLDNPQIGIFIVRPRQADGYSESYRSDAIPWEFERVPVNECRVCRWDFTCEECHS